MASKKVIDKELTEIKNQLEKLKTSNNRGAELIKDKSSSEETNANLLKLIKFMMDENTKTTKLLSSIFDQVNQLAYQLSDEYEENAPALPARQAQLEELPLSGLDAQIIQFIQVKDMACADDIKEHMKYKGRNAASAHLNGLYKRGVLKRYQLGHKVYYKYDAGKSTNTLIVSPPH